MTRDRAATARDLGGIVLAALLLILPGLASVDLFNPDEPREAEIAREMRERGDLVVPRFNDCPFLEKPPLFYWISWVAWKVPGLKEEASVRLPSVLAGLGLLIVTYFLGRALYDRRTGRAAALLLLTTFQFWWLSRRALLDMTLAFFVAAALLCFLLALRPAKDRRTDLAGTPPDPGRTAVGHGSRLGLSSAWMFLAGLAAAGAVLTKGFIGLVIPVLAAAVTLAWRRQLRALLSPALLLAAALPAAAIGLWIGLLRQRPDGACYVREFLIENHLRRFAGGGAGGHAQPPWYYLSALATDFLPWVLFLPCAVAALWPGLRWEPRRRTSRGLPPPASGAFLLAWLLPALVVLSVSSSKRSLYLLPLAPAAALLVAAWWSSAARRARGAGGRLPLSVRVPAWLLAGLGLIVALALPVAFARLTVENESIAARELVAMAAASGPGLAAGAALVALVAAAAVLARRRPRRAAVVAVASTGAVLLLGGAFMLPRASARLSARRFGEAIGAERSRGARVAACRLTEGALGQFLFYAKETVEWIGFEDARRGCTDCRLPISAEMFLRGAGPRALLLRKEDFDRLPLIERQGSVLARGRVGSATYVLISARQMMMDLPGEDRRETPSIRVAAGEKAIRKDEEAACERASPGAAEPTDAAKPILAAEPTDAAEPAVARLGERRYDGPTHD